nr:transposase [Peptacetobacter hominis]
MPRIEEWKFRFLESVYPAVYINAAYFSVKENGVVKKNTAYIILGINSGEYK